MASKHISFIIVEEGVGGRVFNCTSVSLCYNWENESGRESIQQMSH